MNKGFFFFLGVVLTISLYMLHDRMEGNVNLYMHYGGKWVNEPRLNYVGGRVHILEDFETKNVDIFYHRECVQNTTGLSKSLAFVCHGPWNEHE